MSCGGIEPAKLDYKLLPGDQESCPVCNKQAGGKGYVYYCKEFDCWIHRNCVHAYLKTKEGRLVLAHQHGIYILDEGSRE